MWRWNATHGQYLKFKSFYKSGFKYFGYIISDLTDTQIIMRNTRCMMPKCNYITNVGPGKKHDERFATMIEVALKHDKPVRIGVNWGSLDQAVLALLMDENAKSANPKSAREVTHEALILSAINSAKLAESLGL